MVICWPASINAKGEVRHQHHRCPDIVPPILECYGVDMPEKACTIKQQTGQGRAAMRLYVDDQAVAKGVFCT